MRHLDSHLSIMHVVDNHHLPHAEVKLGLAFSPLNGEVQRIVTDGLDKHLT